MMAVHDKLQELLRAVGAAFTRSDIHRWALNAGLRWNYSLITGACLPHAPMIVGFNWGAHTGESYLPQREIEPSP